VLGAPAATGAAVVARRGAVAADALVLLDDGQVDRVAGVVGLSLVAALLHQLVRRGRSRVTESLADTMLARRRRRRRPACSRCRGCDGGRTCCCWRRRRGRSLLVGPAGRPVLPRPVLAAGATRGWPGLLLAWPPGSGRPLAVGARRRPACRRRPRACWGLAAAVTVATADLAVDLGAAELRPGRRDARRVSALRPRRRCCRTPLLGPVALLAGRLVLS
jgi:hypothetical protein